MKTLGNDLSHFQRAAEAGNSVSFDGLTGIRALTTFERLGRFIVKCLLYMPWLGNSEAVRAWAQQIAAGNTRTLALFAAALAKVYGTLGAVAAIDKVAEGRWTRPLTARKISRMVSTAESFRGHGRAKPLARKACLRVWAFKDLSHTGHAAVSIKDNLPATKRRRVNEYVSWWPSARTDITVEGKNESPLAKLPTIGRHFDRRPAIMADGYESDMEDEIAERTNRRLESGEAARETLSSLRKARSSIRDDGPGSSDDALTIKREYDRILNDKTLKNAATYYPRGAQQKLSNGKWGTAAEKVYFPLIGPNRAHEEDTHEDDAPAAPPRQVTLFGLHEADMLADAKRLREDAEAGRIGYTMISTTENCAAVAARSLRAGWSDIYVPFNQAWISEDPNKVHAYGREVQAAIDALNDKATEVKTRSAAAFGSADAPALAEVESVRRALVQSTRTARKAGTRTRREARRALEKAQAEKAGLQTALQARHAAIARHESTLLGLRKAVGNLNRRLHKAPDAQARRLDATLEGKRLEMRREIESLRRQDSELAGLEQRDAQLALFLKALDSDRKLHKLGRMEAGGGLPQSPRADEADNVMNCIRTLDRLGSACVENADGRDRAQCRAIADALGQLAKQDPSEIRPLIVSVKRLVEEAHKLASLPDTAATGRMTALSGVAIEASERLIALAHEQERL